MEALSRLYYLLSPQMRAAEKRLGEQSTRLAHYTTAETALKILRNQSLWLLNVQVMNDFSEVQYGIRHFERLFSKKDGARRQKFLRALDRVQAGAAEEAIDKFFDVAGRLRESTYISCLSEHHVERDKLGRLSMWRAYSGGKNGVALLFNTAPFRAESNVLGAVGTPAVYFRDMEAERHIDETVFNIEHSTKDFGDITYDGLVRLILHWLVFSSVSLKHAGFREEKEWRIVSMPGIFEPHNLRSSIECVKGIPQKIYSIPMVNDPTIGLHGADPDSLLSQIIIGPSDYPDGIRAALCHELEAIGVTEPERRITVSDIPLR